MFVFNLEEQHGTNLIHFGRVVFCLNYGIARCYLSNSICVFEFVSQGIIYSFS